MTWKEVWRKDGSISVEKSFQALVSIEDHISFPQTAEAGSRADCGYINITALDNVKFKVEVTVNDQIATVDGFQLSKDYTYSKGQTLTFPVAVDLPDTSGTVKISVVVYQWV